MFTASHKLANMTSKTLPKTKQRTGLPLVTITVLACVTSLISIVAGIDIGEVAEVAPNSTQHISDKTVRNVSNNTTLRASKPHDRPDSRGTTDASRVSQEVPTGTGDLLGDMITQAFKPGERISDLEWLQNVYNPHIWGLSPPGGLGSKCDADMKTYLTALDNGTVWAAKSTYMHSFDLLNYFSH
jgi:hypothetical protein